MRKYLFFFVIILFLQTTFIYAKVFTITDCATEKEFRQMFRRLCPGDTLILKAGYYRKNFELNNINGLPDIPIVIRGEQQNIVTIDGGALPGNNLTNYGFHLKNCSWLVIDNLSFINCWLDAVRVDESSYISLTNSKIEGSRRAFFAKGRKSHHFLIENCFWEQGEDVWNKQGQYSWDELHHGKLKFYNGSIFQAKMISGSFIIRDNYIKNVYNGIRLSVMGDAEVDTLACTNGEIYRNVIVNSADNAFEPEVYCKNLHFYHNRMINSHAFVSLTEVGGGPLYFYGNTGVKLPDCKDGWTIFKIMGNERRFVRPLYIFNNSWYVDSDVWGRQNELHWNGDEVWHFNNAYYIAKKDTVGIYYLGSNNIFENDCANIPFPTISVKSGKHHSITSDPLFIDGPHGNFLLRENSPCIDKGIIPQNLEIGFIGDKLDIGAYDNNSLVEGPPFRYEDPGVEMPDKEMPRIVKHKVVDNTLKLWFSIPLDVSTIRTNEFRLCKGNDLYYFENFDLKDSGYLLVLKSNQMLPDESISLNVGSKPIGINGESMILWGATIPTYSIKESEEVLNLACKVADQLIKNVSFNFQPQVVNFNANVANLQIKNYMLSDGKQVSGLIGVNSDEEREAILGFSFQGDITVLLNQTIVYSGVSQKEKFKEYTYNRFHFSNQVKIHLKKGNNELLIKSNKNIGSDVRFSCCIQKENDLFDKSVTFQNNIKNPYINNWLIITCDSDGSIVSYELQPPMIQRSLDIMKNIGKKGFTADWNYANSNTLLGILNLYKVSNKYKYREFVERYNKLVIDNYDFFKEQYFSKRILRGTYFRLFRATMLDDMSGSALPFAEMATIAQQEGKYNEILNHVLDYVLYKQERLPNGTFCRPEPIDKTVWADDLFMSVVFLLRMAEVNHNTQLYDEVAFQIIQFNKYLKDKSTQLYKHGWYDQKKEQSPVSWSRANGWIIWATSEVLLKMPTTHKQYNKIKEIFIQHLNAVISYQSENGLWHQVLNRPDSYLETSGSAMFAIGISRAIRKKWLPLSYSVSLLKAWDGIVKQVDKDGNVSGICCGTDMSNDVNYYMKQQTVINDPRGMGAFLTLSTEMFQFFKCYPR